jgi:alpha-tubulin suppressor-like RCC1 family protein/predicted adenine nucleotide alpha hydrolase (AANH) superfamily ATPase
LFEDGSIKSFGNAVNLATSWTPTAVYTGGGSAFDMVATSNKIYYLNLDTPTKVRMGNYVNYGLTATALGGMYNQAIATNSGMNTMVILADGTVWGWGYNPNGCLGDGTDTSRTSPVKMSGITNAIAVSTMCDGSYGSGSTAVVKADGTLWACGYGNYVESVAFINSGTPKQISISNVVAVSVSINNIVALKSDATVWGIGSYFANGQGGTSNSSFAQVKTGASSYLNDVIAVSIIAREAFALKNDGTVWHWGDGYYMPLPQSYYANQLGTITNVIAISACGNYGNAVTFVLMLKADGTVWGVGYNGNSQLGNGTTTNSTNPVQATGLTNVIAIASGLTHCMALKSDGSVWGWGNNTRGQLPGAANPQSTPIKLTGMPSNIVSIGCGGQQNNPVTDGHSYAIDADGNIWTWGYNGQGQLGLGNNTNYSTPQRMLSLNILATGWNDRDAFINFTGQHRCYVDGYKQNELPALEGLIVVTDKNKYKTGKSMGSDAMSTTEALPLVSLSSKHKDKRAFGVIAFEINDPVQRITYLEKLAEVANGDIRAEINSVGEGCVWVSDIDGPLEAGDYMTTSAIPGYASRQNGSDGSAEGFLMNYTVAKITMDCNFDPPMEPHMVLVKDSDGKAVVNADGLPEFKIEMANAYVTKYYVNDVETTQAEYAQADQAIRRLESVQVFDTEYYVGGNQVTKEEYDEAPDATVSAATATTNTTDTPVVVLGTITNTTMKSMKQIPATQPVLQAKYKMRWLKADGKVIGKSEYDTALENGEPVYRAAFVGCTYHCG